MLVCGIIKEERTHIRNVYLMGQALLLIIYSYIIILVFLYFKWYLCGLLLLLYLALLLREKLSLGMLIYKKWKFNRIKEMLVVVNMYYLCSFFMIYLPLGLLLVFIFGHSMKAFLKNMIRANLKFLWHKFLMVF